MKAMRTAGAMLLCLAMLGAAGCAAEKVRENMTVDEAKAIAQAGELDIARSIPTDLVGETVQQPTGSLLSCHGERAYAWAGGTVVHLVGAPEVGDVIDGLIDVYAEEDGWSSKSSTSAHGDPQAEITGPDGDWYLVSGYAEDETIDIDSRSPCFRLPEGQSPRGGF